MVHIYSSSELIEVATFRSGDTNSDGELIKDGSGKIVRDNIWGNLDQDTFRRDFTINALYYCPITKKLLGIKMVSKTYIRKKLFQLEIQNNDLMKIQFKV